MRQPIASAGGALRWCVSPRTKWTRQMLAFPSICSEARWSTGKVSESGRWFALVAKSDPSQKGPRFVCASPPLGSGRLDGVHQSARARRPCCASHLAHHWIRPGPVASRGIGAVRRHHRVEGATTECRSTRAGVRPPDVAEALTPANGAQICLDLSVCRSVAVVETPAVVARSGQSGRVAVAAS